MGKTFTIIHTLRFNFFILFFLGFTPSIFAQNCSDIIPHYDILREVVRNDTVFKEIQFLIQNPNNNTATPRYFLLLKGEQPMPGVNWHRYSERTDPILIPVLNDTITILDAYDLSCSLEIDLGLTQDRCTFGVNVVTALDGDDCSRVRIDMTLDDPTIVLDTIHWYMNGDESVVVHDQLTYNYPPPGNYTVLLTDNNGCAFIQEFINVACPRSNAGPDLPIDYCISEGLPLNLWAQLDDNVDAGQFYDPSFNQYDSISVSQLIYTVPGMHTFYYISKTPELSRDTAIITVDAYSGTCRACLVELEPPVVRCESDTQYIDFVIRGGDGVRDTSYLLTLPDGTDTVFNYYDVFTFRNEVFDQPLDIQIQSRSIMSCDSLLTLGSFPSCQTTKCGYEVVAAIDSNRCYGETIGGIGLSLTNGNGPFTIQWSNNEVGEVIQNLATGDYEAYITDAVGCVDTFAYRVEGPLVPDVINISLDESSQDSVAITIGVGQGNGQFEMVAILDQQMANFTAVRGIDQTIVFEQTKDTAYVSMENAQGCIVDTVLILTPNCAIPEIEQSNLQCGLDNGRITVDIPAEFKSRSSIQWQDMSTNNNWYRDGLGLGDYHFTIQYDQCDIQGMVTIEADAYEKPRIETFNHCSLDGLVTYYIADSMELINWTINDQTYSDFSITLPANENYEILTESSIGCLERFNIYTAEPKQWLNEVGFLPPLTLTADPAIDLSGFLNFGWTQGNEKLCDSCLEFSSEEALQEGLYTFFVEQYPGCSADTVIAVQTSNQYFDMPNVITPMGQRNNFVQIFDPYRRMASIMEFNVYDRYGNLLYVNNNFMPNSEDQLNWPPQSTELPDIIICVAKIKCKNEEEVIFTKSVLVLR